MYGEICRMARRAESWISERVADEIALCRPRDRIQLLVPRGRGRLASERWWRYQFNIQLHAPRLRCIIDRELCPRGTLKSKLKQKIKYHVIKNARLNARLTSVTLPLLDNKFSTVKKYIHVYVKAEKIKYMTLNMIQININALKIKYKIRRIYKIYKINK